ncbi:DnaJ-domain-containing protein [Metschnikowia bicuspidata var. bicuspidata NRRL YB-4993]|uniref:DnaJ-domain-containing protein n=1 Tax=Metschnikowia bicuspidata var. bicuspidata NRRL YB-4993 TaxID=869754 RepID=A0A1A0H8Q7_9ASCO|nr:DnaJ-domain-containing protein [Metschnikowia bicuspidata var. bicuspidata NRRL YB-4993]OBA20396.1 DnaJ-domain-containing protein [Metschnikowia bicuspidata var. bicuspidata NRRL YB-4993]
MNDVTSGRIDIYAELGVAPDALPAEISRKYRQMALRYHPDKNDSAEAAAKFQFFSAINTVLQDADLRRLYDEIRRQRTAIKAPASEGVQSQILRFKEQLRAREQEAKSQAGAGGSPTHAFNVDVLSMRGLALRRELQAKLQAKKGYVSFRLLKQPRHTADFLVQDVVLDVTWKHRSEPGAQIDSGTLREIMERFGPVKTCIVGEDDGRYARGQVVFSDPESTEKALVYDYRKACLWDGTPVRKLASLLRSVKRAQAVQMGEPGRAGSSFENELAIFLKTVRGLLAEDNV